MTFPQPVKSFIVSGTLGPKFCLGTVMPQAWLTTFSARSIYLETLGCVVGALPVQMENIHGSSEDSDWIVIGVKISCGQYPFVNYSFRATVIAIVGSGNKPFSN